MSFTLSVLLLQLLSVTHSDVIQKYTLMSGSIELIGQVPNMLVKSVVWTWNKDKVAEWDKGDMTPTYYPTLNKTELNMDTWALTLSDLQPTCNGQYALQINGIETATSFQLIVLESVSGPNISTNCDQRSCNLTCQGAGIDHTEYSWTDNRGRNERGSVLKVEKTKGLDRVYTCNFSNPVSWNTSSVRERELFPPESTDANLYIILGSMGGAVLIAAAIGIAVYIKKRKVPDGEEQGGQVPGGKEPGSADEANGEDENRRFLPSQQPLQQQALQQQGIQMSRIENTDAVCEMNAMA
ncbi:uncharacterized protein LOC121700756 isoform X4 [Alosa sapidissima]|uniref:uncharacterized protein LOC121700756 isoform X4 n=1 Tax=Alosa sapidissima TaxID=34773 RepID=UPI001C0937B4|nr:uncharacterized protein LOC121700756 isoform X4 [Alosa sapidissima]